MGGAWQARGVRPGKGQEQSLLLDGALDTLRRYAPAKDGLFARRPEVTERELFDEGFTPRGWTAPAV